MLLVIVKLRLLMIALLAWLTMKALMRVLPSSSISQPSNSESYGGSDTNGKVVNKGVEENKVDDD